MAKKRIIILGAGLAGLSIARYLQEKNLDCLVFEKEDEVGGLCRSKRVGGFTFDYAGHLLHFRHAGSISKVRKLLAGNLVRHKRNAQVYLCSRYIRHPFQFHLFGLPKGIIKECLDGFFKAKDKHLRKNEHLNFKEWIKFNFGSGMARHFMYPYNRKFWTVSLQKMTVDWINDFISVPSLSQLIEGSLSGQNRLFGYNAHFWYPENPGIDQLPRALAKKVRNIFTGCTIKGIDLEKKEVLFCSGGRQRFDLLISTIALPQWAGLANGLPQEVLSAIRRLKWNSIYNLNLGIKSDSKPDMHWAYFPQKNLSFYRIGFFHSFSRVPAGTKSMYIEVSYSRDKPIDKKGMVSKIKRDLAKTGILQKKDTVLVQDINDIEYGYPIYDALCAGSRELILKYLESKDVLCCGRYGSWRYLSMEDVILQAGRLAGEICV